MKPLPVWNALGEVPGRGFVNNPYLWQATTRAFQAQTPCLYPTISQLKVKHKIRARWK